MNNSLLKHENSLKSNLLFEILDDSQLYTEFLYNKKKSVYGLITQNIVSKSRRFQPMYIMYLFNLQTIEFVDISISDTRFKVNDVKSMLSRNEVEEGSTIVTLDTMPFTMTMNSKYFESKSYNHVLYKRGDFIPMLDYVKNYINGKVLVSMFTKRCIDNKDVKSMAILWNDKLAPILCESSKMFNLEPNMIFKK